MKRVFVAIATFAVAAAVASAQDYNAGIEAFNAGATALESIAFGHCYPVTHTTRVCLINIANERISVPAITLLMLKWCVDDDTYGKEIVNVVKVHLLCFHLVPDGID